MTARRLSIIAASTAILVSALTALPESAAAQPYPYYCDGYARDYAQRKTRGQVASGAAVGAIGGALIGGLIRRGKGAGRGALIGGGVGALTGGAQKSYDYNALYDRAYSKCMSGY